MILNKNRSDLEFTGDIESIKAQINSEDLGFIVTLLSSNQYSSPEESFIREIVSNAWDSHVAAGNESHPVIIKISKSRISIRDFGTGLSPDDFKRVYCSIGSSTKRESNDFIGMFGLGHLSPLSCSDTVFIDDYYNGVVYHYIMIKDGNDITTSILGCEETSEHNGLDVQIDITDNYRYARGLNNIIFFPNIYVEGEGSGINNVKIRKYKYFSAASISVCNKILLGNVLYPLKWDEISLPNNSEVWNTISNTGVVINFNIGELDITPNREQILYTESTRKIIEERLKEAWEEMQEVVREGSECDYTDFKKYINVNTSYKYFDFLEKCLTTRANNAFGIPKSWTTGCTYKGKSYPASLVYSIVEVPVVGLKAVFTDRFYKQPNTYDFRKYRSFHGSQKIIRLSQNLNDNAKAYISEMYRGPITIIGPTDIPAIGAFKLSVKNSAYTDEQINDFVNVYLEALENYIEDIVVPKRVREKGAKKISEDAIVHEYSRAGWITRKYKNVLDYFYKAKPTVVLNKDDYSDRELDYFDWKNYRVIWVKQSLYNEIMNLGISSVMDKTKALRKAKIYNTYYKMIPEDSYLWRIKDILPQAAKVKRFAIGTEIDEDVKKECDLINKYIQAFKETTNVLTMRDINNNLFWYLFAKLNKITLGDKMWNKVLNDKYVKLCRN